MGTAALIWLTTSSGILIGIGVYFAAANAIILIVGILFLVRKIEAMMPSQVRIGRSKRKRITLV